MWPLREVSRLSRLYAALTAINQAIVRATSSDELLVTICRVLCEQGGFRMAWIGRYQPGTHEIRPVASWGDDRAYLATIQVRGDDTDRGRGPTGTAFREGRGVISNDLSSDPSSAPWWDALASQGYRAAAVFPIREAGSVSGTLSVYAEEPQYFREREVSLLEEAAADLSHALDNFARERERRRTEDTIRRERDFSDAVLRSLPGVLYMYDDQRRFLRWNTNLEQVTGYSATELPAMDPLDLIADRSRPAVATAIEHVFERGASVVEAELRGKQGASRPYHFTGVKVVIDGQPCLIGVGIDLTAQHEAEQAQRESDARYRTLFDHAPDGILILDPSGRCIDANPGICRMLNYRRDELVDANAVGGDWREIVATGERELHRKDGSVVPGDVIATVMPDGNVLAVIRDATARKQAERAIREANESLERKIEERTHELQAALVRAEAADHLKSAFLATMSHELRTPLNSILGFTGILHQGLAGPINAEQRKQLGMVRTSARHLLELINDVLDISKIEAEQLQTHAVEFDVRGALERAVASVLPLAKAKGLTLELVIAPEVTAIVSDRRRVEQVVLNLLSNAIKFTERGGVTVVADRVDATLHIRVRDSGVGIKPEDLAMLFQPFRQIETGLARRHEGTGLGLAISRRLAGLLGGDISVASTVDRGSEFTVTLPTIGSSR